MFSGIADSNNLNNIASARRSFPFQILARSVIGNDLHKRRKYEEKLLETADNFYGHRLG